MAAAVVIGSLKIRSHLEKGTVREAVTGVTYQGEAPR